MAQGFAKALVMHDEDHSVASHDDTTATGAELNTLTDGSNADSLHAHSQFLVFATGDVEAEVKAGTARFKFPFAATLISATVTAGVAPTGADLIVDVNKGGTTMFSTKPQVDAGDQDGTKQTPSVSAIASGDVITVDIDQIGSTLPGENIVVLLEITVP